MADGVLHPIVFLVVIFTIGVITERSLYPHGSSINKDRLPHQRSKCILAG